MYPTSPSSSSRWCSLSAWFWNVMIARHSDSGRSVPIRCLISFAASSTSPEVAESSRAPSSAPKSALSSTFASFFSDSATSLSRHCFSDQSLSEWIALLSERRKKNCLRLSAASERWVASS